MNTGYTPVQGRGFVRPENQNLQNFAEIIPVISGLIGGSETNIVNARALQMFDDEKGVNLTYTPDGNQNMSIISESVFYKLIKTKSAPLPERPCEQLTYCAKNESVRGNYINRVEKRHNCRITGKTKATRYGGPSTQATRYPQRMSITDNATFAAGGQSVRFTPMTLGLTEGHYGECAGLLVGYQPLGSIPRRFSSARPNSLSQLARLMPSLCASLSNCSFSSGEIRILNCGDCPSPLGLLSRLIIDKWSPIELAFLLLGGHLNTGTLKKAKPEGARNTNGLLTTNDSKIIEVAMLNHTTHPQGRDSHNLNK
ncbi:TPA: hypothetical protein ACYQQI_001532, partial [Escherichia coli]